ncbi:MAG: sigma 54-interacting transcriptional regulator [Pseudomonadota bacterium]
MCDQKFSSSYKDYFFSIPYGVLKEKIRKSHERSRQYGIDPNSSIAPSHVSLTEKQIKIRKNRIRSFYDITVRNLNNLYKIISGGGFALILADHEGYILHMVGDPAIQKQLARVNCAIGFRWSEQDVGTTAIALSVARHIPVQITEKEIFCKRGYPFTNSAAPIFDDNKNMLGVIVTTGNATLMHSHTLGMMITAARSIENELGILKKSNELRIQNQSMKAVLQSMKSGIIVLDHKGIVTEMNDHGQEILKGSNIIGSSIRDLTGEGVAGDDPLHDGTEYIDREFFFKIPGKGSIQIMATIRSIQEPYGECRGYVIEFNEINRIHKLVNEMAGSRAMFSFQDIIGVSLAIQQVRKLAIKATRSRSTVLITGETGTGKELFAQGIHNHSEFSNCPFVTINCGAIPRELLESELFGYVGGAFTGAAKSGRPGKFELARGGTVFLDEIGDMPMDMQVKLLRVLQSGEVVRIGEHRPLKVDVRIIAATNIDIREACHQGGFRKDLFYRLNVFPIHIPPLRDRKEDILQLARHFMNRRRLILSSPVVSLSHEAEEVLLKYRWPGNVRELENVIERLLNVVDEEIITQEHLAFLKQPMLRIASNETPEALLTLTEKKAINDTLKDLDYNIAQASQALGISRPTLYRKMKKYGLLRSLTVS